MYVGKYLLIIINAYDRDRVHKRDRHSGSIQSTVLLIDI